MSLFSIPKRRASGASDGGGASGVRAGRRRGVERREQLDGTAIRPSVHHPKRRISIASMTVTVAMAMAIGRAEGDGVLDRDGSRVGRVDGGTGPGLIAVEPAEGFLEEARVEASCQELVG